MFKSRWTPFLNDHTQISIWKGHSHMIDLQIFRSRWTHTRNKHTTKIKKECQTGGFLVIRHKSCERHKKLQLTSFIILRTSTTVLLIKTTCKNMIENEGRIKFYSKQVLTPSVHINNQPISCFLHALTTNNNNNKLPFHHRYTSATIIPINIIIPIILIKIITSCNVSN